MVFIAREVYRCPAESTPVREFGRVLFAIIRAMRSRLRFLTLTLPFCVATLYGATNVTKLVQGAQRQVGVTRYYESQYRKIGYPGGDLPLDRGVCTDVIIRAYRNAGIDLQVLVHEDMAAHFSAYPKLWGLRGPDPNIDHRRVPNLATFFHRHGTALPVTRRAADYKPGDIVTWQLADGLSHIGVVSEVKARSGRYLMVHNIGAGAQIEDVLFAYKITGHYRY
jgi:uncharacterized protein YijF (DUF1287 family)